MLSSSSTRRLKATLVSCMTALWPSPDRFVGVSAFQVCKGPRTIPVSELRVYHAELDDIETLAGERKSLKNQRAIHLRPDIAESILGWVSVKPLLSSTSSLAFLPGSHVSRQVSKSAVDTTTPASTLVPSPSVTPTPTLTPTLTPSPSPPPVPKCVGIRTFTVQLKYSWKPQFVPPDLNPPKAGFTPLVCAAHNANFSLWKVGSMVSDAVHQLVVFKNITTLLQKLYAHRDQNQSIVSYNRSSLPNVASPGFDSVNVTVDPRFNATLISCIA
eukprot:IDg8432t1